MNLAYIVSAYKYPEQLVRLVERLDTDGASFYVHVDRKAEDAAFRRMVDGLRQMTNVEFLPRHRCEWGGFGHVAATLEGIRAVIRSGTDFAYAILLTGQDYPIRSNADIVSFLERHRGQLFLEYFPLPHPGWQGSGMDRIRAWHWRFGGRHIVVAPGRPLPFQRKIPGGLLPFGGSSYWCLTRECVAYIHDYVEANPRFVDFFRHVDVPDELFLQTIILNSPFAHAAVNDNLRYIDWRDDSGSPAILTTADLGRLASSTQLFARKFDVTVDAEVLDAIDRMVRTRDKSVGVAR